jgi:3-dehydroquinate synthase
VSDLPAPAVLSALSRDKKARAGRVPFVLPVAVGRVEIRDDVARAEVVRALRVMAGREARLA